MQPGWDLERIRAHVRAHLPIAALLGIDVVEVDAERCRVRLVESLAVFRPGGSVAGPVLFAMADIATYGSMLMLRDEVGAVTASLAINFLRPAVGLPLLCEAVPLRAGRRLVTFDVRIWAETTGSERLLAQATATWVAT